MWQTTARTTIATVSRRLPPFKGKTRVLRRLDALIRGDGGAIDVEIDGIRWQLQTEDLIQFRVLYQGVSSPHVVAWLARELRGGGVLWDIGANVGTVSLPIARRLRGVRVDAFEASPQPSAAFRRHLALNPALADRIHLHEVAMTDHIGEVRFHPSNERHNSGVGSLTAMHNTQATPIVVPATTGDALIADGRCALPDLVKIDVEGWEHEVLRGMTTILEGHRPTLLFEHAIYRLRARGLAHDANTRHLEDLGYSVMRLTAEGGEAPIRSLDVDMDIIARAPR